MASNAHICQTSTEQLPVAREINVLDAIVIPRNRFLAPQPENITHCVRCGVQFVRSSQSISNAEYYRCQECRSIRVCINDSCLIC